MNANRPPRVAHVVPAMEVGGVEVAIVRSYEILNATFDYRVFFVRRHGQLSVGQRSVWSLIAASLTNRWRPDVIVTSLWWSHPIGMFLALFGIRWVAFFHNCGYKRWYQGWVLRSSWRRAGERFVDSEATGNYFNQFEQRDFEVIPYLFDDRLSDYSWIERDYDLIWVGRPVRAKRLDLVRQLLEELASRRCNARVCLVFAGALPDEFASCEWPPEWVVECYQSLDAEAVWGMLANSRFLVILSDFEGMSMTTIEAIFAGCVPIARRVGELRNYIDSDYKLAVADSELANLGPVAERITACWDDSEFAGRQIAALRQNIRRYPTYPESIIRALRRVLQH